MVILLCDPTRNNMVTAGAYRPAPRHVHDPPSCPATNVEHESGWCLEVINSWRAPNTLEKHVIPNIPTVNRSLVSSPPSQKPSTGARYGPTHRFARSVEYSDTGYGTFPCPRLVFLWPRSISWTSRSTAAAMRRTGN